MQTGRVSTLYFKDIFVNLCKDLKIPWRDRTYLMNRIESEGLHFACIVLPKFGDAVLYSLEYSLSLKRSCYHMGIQNSFRIRKDHHFLATLYKQISQSDKVSAAKCLKKILTVCQYFKKLCVDFPEDVIAKATTEFITKNETISNVHKTCPEIRHLRRIAKVVFPSLFEHGFSFFSEESELCVGPGTVSIDRNHKHSVSFSSDQEFKQSVGSKRPRSSRPYKRLISRSFPTLTEKETDQAVVSELLLVPKSYLKPRVIVREPDFHLRMQSAFFLNLCDKITKMTNGHLNVLDQSINQDMCWYASSTKRLSVFDVSGGSNCVSLRLFANVFDCHAIREILQFRTQKVFIPAKAIEPKLCGLGRKVIYSNKFGYLFDLHMLAGMGSYLTFLAMEMLFYVMSIYAVLNDTYQVIPEKESFIRKFVQRRCQDIFYYGDDGICNTADFKTITSYLHSRGVDINLSKSYTHSSFRESCGKWFLYGENVTPLRFSLVGNGIRQNRQFIDLSYDDEGFLSKDSTKTILTIVGHMRELWDLGYLKTYKYLKRKIATVLQFSSCDEDDILHLPDGNPFTDRIHVSRGDTFRYVYPNGTNVLVERELSEYESLCGIHTTEFDIHYRSHKPIYGISEWAAFQNKLKHLSKLSNLFGMPGVYELPANFVEIPRTQKLCVVNNVLSFHAPTAIHPAALNKHADSSKRNWLARITLGLFAVVTWFLHVVCKLR